MEHPVLMRTHRWSARASWWISLVGLWALVLGPTLHCVQTVSPEANPEAQADASTPEMTTEGTPVSCTGMTPPYPDVMVTAPPDNAGTLPMDPTPAQICQQRPGQCLGSTTPSWKAEDFQPESCGYQQSYNLQAFRGHVTVVALLAGW